MHRILFTLAATAALLWPLVAPAEVQGTFFQGDGTPTKEMKQLFDAPGKPALLKGVEIPAAYKDASGKWQKLEDDACVVTKFHVGPNGVMDRYVVLDSAPNSQVEAAALYAISQWRFAPSAQGAWFVFPWTIAFVPAVQGSTDTRLGKLSAREKFNYSSTASCLVPVVQSEYTQPTGAVFAMEADLPVPGRDTIKARQTGCTTLTYTIQPDGSTSDFEALDAKPGDLFVTAGAVAVSGWKFKPQTRSQRGFVSFSFGLDTPKASAAPTCMSSAFAAAHYKSTEGSK